MSEKMESDAVKITVTMDWDLGEVWENGRVHFAPQVLGFSVSSKPIRLAAPKDGEKDARARSQEGGRSADLP